MIISVVVCIENSRWVVFGGFLGQIANDSHVTEWCVLGYCSHTPPDLLFVSPVLQSELKETPTYLPVSITPHHPPPSKSIQQMTGTKLNLDYCCFLVVSMRRTLAAVFVGEGQEGPERIKNHVYVPAALA